MHQGRLAEARARAEGVGLDHPELVQQLAHRGRFGGRQWQVVGAAGEGEGAGGAVEAPAGGVAEGLRAAHQQVVVVALFGQPPGRAEAGDAAAENGDAGVDLAPRGGQRCALAQRVAGLHAGAQYGDRDAQVLQPPAAGQGGEACGSGGCGDEAAPADHRITLPQSSSK